MDGDDKTVVRHLFFNSKGEASEEERDGKKLIWKDILREGHFAMTPGLGNRTEPFDVVTTGPSSAADRRISLESLNRNFHDKAIEHVTVPLKHRDEEIDNTGFIEDTRIITKPNGKQYLQGAFGLTEPDIAGKVRRGTIPNCSSGILFDFTRKADGKKFDSVLYHVKLTKSPWITDLEPFARVLASDDAFDGDVEIQSFQFADDDEASGDTGGKTATIAWDEQQGFNWVRNQIQSALRPEPTPDMPVDDGRPMQPRAWYYVDDVSDKLALVTEEFKGTVSRLLIPWSRKDDGNGVDLAPQVRWQTVKEAFIAASDDDFKAASTDTLRDKISAELADRFGDEATGLSVDGIAVNNIVKLRKKSSGEAWLAHYFLSDERVHIAPSPTWEKVENAPPPKKAPSTVAQVVTLSDDPIAAARRAKIERNKRLLAINGHNTL